VQAIERRRFSRNDYEVLFSASGMGYTPHAEKKEYAAHERVVPRLRQRKLGVRKAKRLRGAIAAVSLPELVVVVYW
jgi:hypothetical protein